ncbi:MAG TPA: cytochrome C oxidase subunit IV family protein [Casimicrobiaceae bacterium]|nr:cytochrome C oxidase subunit IV family protein [Casimicrobiaceae bacterium]
MKPLTLRRHLLVGLALFVLLALTAGSALLPLGAFNAVSNFAIAAVKAALVVVFFMHLGRGDAAVRIAAAAGVLWLGFLVALSLVDFLGRGY